MVLTKQVILTDKAPKPLSVLNQGLVVGDMVYCSGQVGTDPATGKLVEGTVTDRAVSLWKSYQSQQLLMLILGTSLEEPVSDTEHEQEDPSNEPY
jgi:2-iminobutanoate/2-iminopropanoate deaminase